MCVCIYARIKVCMMYQLCKSESMEIIMYKRIQVYKCAGKQIFKCVGMPLCKYTNLQESKYERLKVCKFLSM